MDGLSAKVFRTFNASFTLQQGNLFSFLIFFMNQIQIENIYNQFK